MLRKGVLSLLLLSILLEKSGAGQKLEDEQTGAVSTKRPPVVLSRSQAVGPSQDHLQTSRNPSQRGSSTSSIRPLTSTKHDSPTHLSKGDPRKNTLGDLIAGAVKGGDGLMRVPLVQYRHSRQDGVEKQSRSRDKGQSNKSPAGAHIGDDSEKNDTVTAYSRRSGSKSESSRAGVDSTDIPEDGGLHDALQGLQWNDWHSMGSVSTQLNQLEDGRQELLITCTAEQCGPGAQNEGKVGPDGTGLMGVFLNEIQLRQSKPYLFGAVAITQVDRQSQHESGGSDTSKRPPVVCPLVTAFTRALAGRAGDWETLVGNCQSPVPSQLEMRTSAELPISAASFVSLKSRSRYRAGLYFGEGSKRGDNFLVRHVSIQELALSQPETETVLVPFQPGDELRNSFRSCRNEEGWAGCDAEGTGFDCPMVIELPNALSDVQKKYDHLIERLKGQDAPLHHYSYYGGTSLKQWDELVDHHVKPLGYKKGQTVFEAGCAAGAFLDSIQRQYQTAVSGVDIAGRLVEVARRRVRGSFCTADASNVSFIADNKFDHSLSFGVSQFCPVVQPPALLLDGGEQVLTYARGPFEACLVASELLRVTKVGGTVFLGQINDPAVIGYRPPRMEGGQGVFPDYWHKFAYETRVSLNVIRGEEIYSKRVIPNLDHYDLHGYFRYNVYMTKDEGYIAPNCKAFRSARYVQRFTVDGLPCAQPFYFQGVSFDDCTTVRRGVGEWCCTDRVCADDNWARCASVYNGFPLGQKL